MGASLSEMVGGAIIAAVLVGVTVGVPQFLVPELRVAMTEARPIEEIEQDFAAIVGIDGTISASVEIEGCKMVVRERYANVCDGRTNALGVDIVIDLEEISSIEGGVDLVQFHRDRRTSNAALEASKAARSGPRGAPPDAPPGTFPFDLQSSVLADTLAAAGVTTMRIVRHCTNVSVVRSDAFWVTVYTKRPASEELLMQLRKLRVHC